MAGFIHLLLAQPVGSVVRLTHVKMSISNIFTLRVEKRFCRYARVEECYRDGASFVIDIQYTTKIA